MISAPRIRENIPSLLNSNSIGCEIGIFEGDYSQILADSGRFSKLYLVDIFSGPASSGDKYGRNIKTHVDGSVLLQYNQNRFANYDFIHIVKQDSVSFLNEHIDYFDFIYIDTVHTYDFTIRELEAAYGAIKNGGIISGHDYNTSQYAGLVRAVQEFTQKYNLQYVTTSEDILDSFIIQKL